MRIHQFLTILDCSAEALGWPVPENCVRRPSKSHGIQFMPRFPVFSIAVASAMFVSALCGCVLESVDGPSGTDPDNKAGGGRIQIDGSSTVKVITAAVAEEFQNKFRDVQIALKVTGTGTGFKEMIAGRIDIANASRAIKDSELSECQMRGIDLLELKVALDGLTVCVNRNNDWVDSITVEQLRRIWEPGSTVRVWKDVDPSWPNVPITLFGAGEESGTFDYFTEAINGKEDAITENYSPSADDNVTITGIAGDTGGMGFFGCAYYFASQDKIRALRISPTSDPKDGVAPEPESVQSGAYTPLSRPLFIYVKKSSLNRPEVRDFVEYYLNEGNALVREVGYVEVSPADLQNARTAFLNAVPQ